MVTMQSIMNADLDSSTTEWIEAQLSAGARAEPNDHGEVKWAKLRTGLQGVVHRLAAEVGCTPAAVASLVCRDFLTSTLGSIREGR